MSTTRSILNEFSPLPESIAALGESVQPADPGTIRIDMKKILVAYYEQQAALAAAVLRAEAAEADRDGWKLRAMQSEQQRQSLRAERDALRTVDDAMVWRAMRAFSAAADDEGTIAVYGPNWMRAALTAALAVQPTTGERT